MIAGIPIILVSENTIKLVAMCEVLKTLMFPLEYQGLVIPYEPKPQLKLLLSGEPYLIGLSQEVNDLIKINFDKHNLLVYDLDQKEVVPTTDSCRIVCKLNNANFQKKVKKVQFPLRYKKDLLLKLESLLKHKEGAKPSKVYCVIRETFLKFFETIIDLKNMSNIEDYGDIPKMLKKKTKHKEHKYFLNNFIKTETYYAFAKNIMRDQDGTMYGERFNLAEFLKERKSTGGKFPVLGKNKNTEALT